MTYATYVFMILIPFYNHYQIMTAEPNTTFRECMIKAETYNNKMRHRKSFAVCMPTLKTLDADR